MWVYVCVYVHACVCVCVCVYFVTRVHMNIYTHTYSHAHLHMYTYSCIYMYTYIHLYPYIQTRMYICMCVCVCVCVDMYRYVCTFKNLNLGTDCGICTESVRITSGVFQLNQKWFSSPAVICLRSIRKRFFNPTLVPLRACVCFVCVCKRGVIHSLRQSRSITFQQRPCRVCGSAVQWLESVYDTQRVALDPVGSLRQRLTSGAPA